MKKLFFIISVMFISVTPSFADIGPFTIDVLGAYVDAGDLKGQTGFGGGFGMGITNILSLHFRFIQTEATENANKYNETNFEHMTMQIGAEYVPVIPMLEKYQLSWNTSIYLGISESHYEYYNAAVWPYNFDYDDDGYSVSIWTGPHFDLTQYISFFLEVGYHYGYYKGELQDESIYGFQALIGARCTLFGSRDYTEGY